MIALALLAVVLAPASAPFVYVLNGHLVHSALGIVKRTHDVREPALSPDGKKALYWQSGEVSPVYEVDLATGRRRKVGGTNARSPFYSSDGKTIYFMQSLPWQLLAVPTSGGKPSVLFGKAQRADDLFMPSLSFGSSTILVQDMKRLYWIGPQGKVVKSVPIAEIVPNEIGNSSANRFAERPGNLTQVLFSFDIPLEKGQPKDWETSTALFLIDLSTHARRRVTPPGLFATDPRWTRDGSKILFRSSIGKGVDWIFSIDADGTNLKKLSPGGEPGT